VIIELMRALRDKTGNLPPMAGVFPDYTAPVVRNAPDGVRELMLARWGSASADSLWFAFGTGRPLAFSAGIWTT
jgi:putative SOS response-associated peptidase YedK